MSIEHKLLYVAVFAFIFFSGWIIGKMSREKGGTIRIETNEDGSRDVIRFILNLDLDDIRKEKTISFKVEDLSQNSHPHK